MILLISNFHSDRTQAKMHVLRLVLRSPNFHFSELDDTNGIENHCCLYVHPNPIFQNDKVTLYKLFVF